MSEELRCDCDPDARPVVREVDRVPACLHLWYVHCRECDLMGDVAQTQKLARKAWRKMKMEEA